MLKIEISSIQLRKKVNDEIQIESWKDCQLIYKKKTKRKPLKKSILRKKLTCHWKNKLVFKKLQINMFWSMPNFVGSKRYNFAQNTLQKNVI